MKRILFFILLLSGIAAEAQTDDSTRYTYYRYNYGSRYHRVQVDSIFGIPKDTATNARENSIAAKNYVLYIKNATAWVPLLNDYYTKTVVNDSLADHWAAIEALQSDSYVIENMAVTDLTATGHRLHDWADYQLKVHGLGELELKSTVSGSRYSQIADAKPYFSGFNLYTQYDASNTAYISLNNANNASYLYFQTIKPGATTNMWIRPDSIDIRPHLGRINIDTLAEASNMTNKKVTVWDEATGRLEQINKDSVGTVGGGGDYNLIVQKAGGGEQSLYDSGDTLYHKGNQGYAFIDVSTDTDSTLIYGLDTASADLKSYIAANSGSSSSAFTDSIQVVADDTDMTGNIAFNTSLNRVTIKTDSFYLHIPITDSVRHTSSGGGSYDSDAQAFFTAAGITDNTQKTAVNDLVLDLKAASLWTNAKAIYPFVGGTATTHKYNLRNPVDTDGGFRLVWNGTWTHNSNGVTGDGTSAYAQTFFVPNTQFTALNASWAYVSKTESDAGVDFGANDGGGGYYSAARFSGNFNTRINGGTVLVAVASSIGSFIGTTRTGPAQEIYRNGTSVQTGALSDYRTAYPVFIGANNNAGSAVNYSTRNFSFMMFYAASLSDAEAATLHTIMTDYNTALGR